MRRHGRAAFADRSLFSLTLESAAQFPNELELPEGHFVCLLAWDASRATDDEITRLADRLLRAGVSYFMAFGPDCERVHDLFDDTEIEGRESYGIPEEASVMTTWHDDESLREVLCFFLMGLWPMPHFEETTNTALVISIGSTAWNDEIRAALEDPRRFVDAVLAEEEAQECEIVEKPSSLVRRFLSWFRS